MIKFVDFTVWLGMDKKKGGTISICPDQVVTLTDGITLDGSPIISTTITTLDGKDREVLGLREHVKHLLNGDVR